MQHYRFTQTGRAHVRAGLGNQDCMKFAVSHDVVIQVMGDGMSGEALGEEAAQIAVEALFSTACSTMLLGAASFRASARVAIQAGFAAAFNALQSAAVANEWDVGWLQTTLMAAIYQASTGEMSYGYVGDGLLAARSAASSYLVEQPQKGAVANQTFGVLDCPMWRFGHLGRVSSFCMATDGLGDCLSVAAGALLEATRQLDALLGLWAEGEELDEAYLDACFGSRATHPEAAAMAQAFGVAGAAPLPCTPREQAIRAMLPTPGPAQASDVLPPDLFSCVEDDRSIAVVWSGLEDRDFGCQEPPGSSFAPVGSVIPARPVALRAYYAPVRTRFDRAVRALRRGHGGAAAVERM